MPFKTGSLGVFNFLNRGSCSYWCLYALKWTIILTHAFIVHVTKPILTLDLGFQIIRQTSTLRHWGNSPVGRVVILNLKFWMFKIWKYLVLLQQIYLNDFHSLPIWMELRTKDWTFVHTWPWEKFILVCIFTILGHVAILTLTSEPQLFRNVNHSSNKWSWFTKSCTLYIHMALRLQKCILCHIWPYSLILMC